MDACAIWAPGARLANLPRMTKSCAIALLFLLVILNVEAAPRNPRSNVLGLRLGMGEDAAHRRLKRISHQQNEDKESEGEKEVWLLRDRRLAYVILRFNSRRELWHITVVVREGSKLRYDELGD